MTSSTRHQIFNEAVKGLQDSGYPRTDGLVTARARGFEAKGISGLDAVEKLLFEMECSEFVARKLRKYGPAEDFAALPARDVALLGKY